MARRWQPRIHARSVPNLLNWIRRYSKSNGDDPIHLFGYDIQQPWHDYPPLVKSLNEALPKRIDELR